LTYVSGMLRVEKQNKTNDKTETEQKPWFGLNTAETEPKLRFFKETNLIRTVIQNIQIADHCFWLGS